MPETKTTSAGSSGAGGKQRPKPTIELVFHLYASQALLNLGLIPHPSTGKSEVNLAEAKFAIDLLEVLEEKTKGNLSDSERRMLTEILHQARMTYLGAKKKSQDKPQEKSSEKPQEKPQAAAPAPDESPQ
jgi:hypothetical protein